jgi:hypothetical protein
MNTIFTTLQGTTPLKVAFTSCVKQIQLHNLKLGQNVNECIVFENDTLLAP